MKVGIDLSSTNTGLVILSDDNKLVFHGNFQLWDKSSQKPLRVMVAELIDAIEFKLINKSEQVFIGIELSDFKNAMLTTRFNLIAGAIFQELYHRIWDTLGNFKLFNSNEWQSLLAKQYHGSVVRYEKNKKVYYDFYHCLNKNAVIQIKEIFDSKRKLLKALSRDFTMWNCIEYEDIWTEDECDAYCIAYFLPQLRDRTQMHQEVKAKKVQTKKSKAQELRAKASKEHKISKLKDIVIKYKSMEKLTKAQQRALDNAIKELKELENDN